MNNGDLLAYSFGFWATGFEDKKLLFSKSSSSSPNKPLLELLVIDILGLFIAGLVALENFNSLYYSSSKRLPFLDCVAKGPPKGCLAPVFGNEDIDGPPNGPPNGWFDLVGNFGKNGAGCEIGCCCCFFTNY